MGSGPFASSLSFAKRLNKARRGSSFPMNGWSAGSRQTCARLPNPLSPWTSPKSPSAEAGTATASATAMVARSPCTAVFPRETYLHDSAGLSGVVFRISRAASIESWRRNIDPARGLRNLPRSDSDRRGLARRGRDAGFRHLPAFPACVERHRGPNRDARKRALPEVGMEGTEDGSRCASMRAAARTPSARECSLLNSECTARRAVPGWRKRSAKIIAL